MRAVVIAHGTIQDFDMTSSFISPNDLVIAADGGALHARDMGILPHVLIGDLDSLGDSEAEILENSGVKLIKHPKDKDYTDSHLALKYALEAGAKEVIFLAALGTRLDHTLGNLLLSYHPQFKNLKIIFRNEEQDVQALKKGTALEGKPGDTFSLVPLDNITGLTIQGAKFPLENANAPFGGSLTLSNEFLEEKIYITWDSGDKILLVRLR